MAVGISLAPMLLKLSGAEGNVLEMGVAYLCTVYSGSIFVNFMQGTNMVIRAEGRMGTAMGIIAGAAILNIILDPIFILTFPACGAQALALATVLSQFIQADVTLIYFLKKSPVVRFHGVYPAKELIPEVLSVGVSAMFMQIMMLVQMTAVYNTAVRFGGANQIALMGAAQRVMQLAFVPRHMESGKRSDLSGRAAKNNKSTHAAADHPKTHRSQGYQLFESFECYEVSFSQTEGMDGCSSAISRIKPGILILMNQSIRTVFTVISRVARCL